MKGLNVENLITQHSARFFDHGKTSSKKYFEIKNNTN